MKRVFVLLLALALLAGCAAGEIAPQTVPQTRAPERTEAPAQSSAQTEPETEPEPEGELRFATTDLEGNPVSAGDFRDAKLIMLNFWEPWCGPCVRELPDLARLYEDYKDRGLVILGVFHDMEDEAGALVKENGVTYPVLHAAEELNRYMTDYVPTTVFFRGGGALLSAEPFIGARDYADWEQIVRSYLGD